MVKEAKNIEKNPAHPNHPKRMKPKTGGLENTYETSAGKSYPLGATVYPNGVNFSIFSKLPLS